MVTAGDGGVDAIEPDGIVCSGGMAATNPLCTEQFKNADLATLKVVPEAGYAFAYWDMNGGIVQHASAEPLFLSTMPLLASNGPVMNCPQETTGQPSCSHVEFHEAPSQQYGFDDFTYQHAAVSEEDTAVWKSVEFSQHDPIGLSIVSSGNVTLDDVVFTSPEGCAQLEKAEGQWQVSGDSRGDCQIQARYQNAQGAELGKMNATVYKPKSRNLAIRSVTPTTSQPLMLDENTLKTYLNEIVYNQAIFFWKTLEVYSSLVIPYDSNGNSCVDVGGDQDEALAILNTPDAIISELKTTTIFLVPCLYDHVRQMNLPGFAKDKAVFVAYTPLQGVMNEVIAHELGHAVFAIPHACSSADPLHGCASPPYAVDDTQNLMWTHVSDPLRDRPMLRFWQWERIQHTE